MIPESGTKAEIKRWVITTLEKRVNHGRGISRLLKTLQRGKRIFDLRKSRHCKYCMVGEKFYNFKFPFVHYRLRCNSICLCEINELLRSLKTTAHELTESARALSDAAQATARAWDKIRF